MNVPGVFGSDSAAVAIGRLTGRRAKFRAAAALAASAGAMREGKFGCCAYSCKLQARKTASVIALDFMVSLL